MKKRIVNPETLTPHIGHHLSAHGYADKMPIHVMSVKVMKMDNSP